MNSENTEQNITNPEMSTAPKYALEAQRVIQEAAEAAPATEQRFQTVDTFVDTILLDALEGKITGSHGAGADGEKVPYSQDDILERLGDFIKEMRLPADKQIPNPYALIPSAEGARKAVRLLYENDATQTSLVQSIELHNLAKERLEETVEPESAHKAGEAIFKAIQYNSGESVMAESAQQPSAEEAPKLTQAEYLEKMTEGLSETDKDNLNDYATSMAAERRARRTGESDNVRYWYKEQEKTLSKMSPDAQNIAKRYAEATLNYYSGS